MSSTAGAVETRSAKTVAMDRDLAAAVWLALLLLAGGLSLFLTWRRIAGALVQPPSGGALVAAAIALSSAVALMRSLVCEGRFSLLGTEYSVLSTQVTNLLTLPSQSTSQLLLLLPGVAAVLFMAALTLPGTPAWGIATAWFVLIAGETMTWLLHLRPPGSRSTSPPRRPLADAEAPAAVDESEIPPGLVQRVTRIRENDRELLHALLQAEVPADDRIAVVHLAFCPPLAARPELTAHAMESEDAEIRVTQVETFGARIEVRLTQAEEEPRRVLIEVLGSVTSPRRA
jgi:hypothetical protein